MQKEVTFTSSTLAKNVVQEMFLKNLLYYLKKVNVACAGIIKRLQKAGICGPRKECKFLITAIREDTGSKIRLFVLFYLKPETYEQRLETLTKDFKTIIRNELGPQWRLLDYEYQECNRD